MTKKFTTIRVYESDKDRLIESYGGPAHEAVSKAVNENCPHPEESRSYLTASLPMADRDRVANSNPRRQVGGFYCGRCGRYVFKNSQSQETVTT